jgi:hypothetical protein
MLTISSTTLTFESSRKPCAMLPRASVPGTPACGSPEAVVTAKRLPPSGFRPAAFWKVAISMVPSCCAAACPGMATETMPPFDTEMEVALAGIEICGCTG